MDVRPVDMQVMLQRAAMLNRVTNNDGSRAETQNNQFANEFAKAREQDATSVTKAVQPDEAELNKDGRGTGGEHNSKGKKKGEQKDEKPKKNMPDIGQGMLDIRI